MNLWLINQYAIPPRQAGITRHHLLARALVERGHTVTIIASSFDHVTQRETLQFGNSDFTTEAIDGVEFLWLRTPPYSGNGAARVRNMLAFARHVWQGKGLARRQPPDVILGSSPHLFAALAASRLARRYGVPFVLEVRDLWPQSLIDLGNVSASHPLVLGLGLIERHLYRCAERIVTLLPAAADHIVAKGGEASKISWVPNGVDLTGSIAAAGVKLSAIDNTVPFTVMYAGTHGLANALDSVLDAAAIVRDDLSPPIVFRLVGDGPQKIRLMDRAKAMGLNNVVFEPPVPKEAVAATLASADAFVVTLRDTPLYRHGTSLNKLFDYLASGRPVVFGTSDDANPVTVARAGLQVAPEDANQIAAALRHLASADPSQRAAMGTRGREYVARHHDMPSLAQRLEDVLVAACSG